MFEWLKERIGKKEDVLEFKDHVVGSSTQIEKPLWQKELDYSQPAPPERGSERNIFDRRFEPAPNFDRRSDLAPALDTRLDDEPPSINTMQRASRFPSAESRSSNEEVRRIQDGLVFIREQLSAIKAQNEMINERLKNLERTLVPERY